MTDDDLDPGRLLERARLSQRSPLYQWLHARHASLALSLRVRRPPWSALVLTIRDSSEWAGKPSPTRHDVRGTWLRLEKDKQTEPVVTPPAPPPPPPPDAKPLQPPAVTQPQSDQDNGGYREPRSRFHGKPPTPRYLTTTKKDETDG
jgi:hypothetical protein